MRTTLITKRLARLGMTLLFLSQHCFAGSEAQDQEKGKAEGQSYMQQAIDGTPANYQSPDTYNPSSSSGSTSNGSGMQMAGAALNLGLAGGMAYMSVQKAMEASSCGFPGCQAVPIGMSVFLAAQAAMGFAQGSDHSEKSANNNLMTDRFRTNLSDKKDPLKNTDPTKNKDPDLADPTLPKTPSEDPSGDPNNPRNPLVDARTSTKSDPFGGLTGPARENLQKLADKGIKLDMNKKTITLPDGTSLSLSEASNASALAAKLDLPSSFAQKANSMLGEIMQKHSEIHGLGDGGSASAAVSGAGFEDDYGAAEASDPTGGKWNQNAKNAGAAAAGMNARNPASTGLVAGLTSKYNGENIGVSAENIFTMVQRRYQLKQDQDSFISSDKTKPPKPLFEKPSR